MKLFLCGFSGAGKTTLGEKLSRNDQFGIFDLDEEIFNRMGSGHDSLSDYIEEIGIEEFRKDELSVVKMLHQNFKDNYLIVLGAGALETTEVRDFISNIGGKLIYLEATFEECFERLTKAGGRPLMKKGKQFMQEAFNRRVPIYSKSDLKISQETAQEISNFGDLLKLL